MNRTEVINFGLISLGQRPLKNPDILDSEEARIMASIYTIVRDELIGQIEWPEFVKVSGSLPTLEMADTREFDYVYKVPSDKIRILTLLWEDGTELRRRDDFENYSKIQTRDWLLEKNKLYCSAQNVRMKYLFAPELEETFSNAFGVALAAALAYRASMRVSADKDLQGQMYQLYQTQLMESKGQALSEGWGVPAETAKWSDVR